MTNTELLKGMIASKGLSITFVAASVGLSRQAFYSKLNNSSEFTTTEITKLCKLIGVKSLKEKEKIFFATNVT